MIYLNVSPAARVRIHDLQGGGLACELADVPRLPEHDLQLLRILPSAASGSADDLAIDDEIEACLSFMRPATDEEVKMLSINRERR